MPSDLQQRLEDLQQIAQALASELRDYVRDSPALEAFEAFETETKPELRRSTYAPEAAAEDVF